MKKPPRPHPRWLVRKECGCRVLAPGPGGVLTPFSLKHCRFHAAAEDMFWVLAALHFESKMDQKWRDWCKEVLFRELYNDFRSRMKEVVGYVGDVTKIRAHFLDSDAAILAGEHGV